MKRSEITKFLSRLLEKSRFSGPGKYWAREVSLDYGYAAGKPRRVDTCTKKGIEITKVENSVEIISKR